MAWKTQVAAVQVDRARVGALVRKVGDVLRGEEPGAEVQAALLILVWCSMFPTQVALANENPEEAEEILSRAWTFANEASKWVALQEAEPGETVQ